MNLKVINITLFVYIVGVMGAILGILYERLKNEN